MRLNNKGFGLVETLLVIVVIAVIGVGGWAVYHNGHKSKPIVTTKTSANTNQQKSNSSTNTTKTSTASTTSPILGESWAPSQQGYSTVKPSEINNGGDPTGTVTNVTWQSWGSSEAIGQGTSTYVAPSSNVSQGTNASATVVAFNLATCQGKTAYTAIEWYFPQYGGSFDSSHYRNICTGQEVGK